MGILMANDVTIIIADADRISGLRAERPIAGPVLYFSDANLASALETIRSQSPKAVAVESHFADSGAGKAFIDRLRALTQDADIKLLTKGAGGWTTASANGKGETAAAAAAAGDSELAGLNTRRAPRFLVVEPADAVVDGTTINIIDVSVLGAQVLSELVMRPKQRVKITIQEGDAGIRVAGRVAWSVYEKLKDQPLPRYRVGMEFDDGTRQELQEFLKKHCANEPLPYKG
jgi:ActR/RegA family two-component response regulator